MRSLRLHVSQRPVVQSDVTVQLDLTVLSQHQLQQSVTVQHQTFAATNTTTAGHIENIRQSSDLQISVGCLWKALR